MSFTLPVPWLTKLEKRIKKPFALFLDFDGTLVPIAKRPGLAVLDPTIRRLLRFLSFSIPVAMVSGRGLKDLKQKVGVKGLYYVGNHGLEMDGPSLRYRMKDATPWKKFLRRLVTEFSNDLGGIPGIHIEDKGYSLSIHYRLTTAIYRRKAAHLFKSRIQKYIKEGRIRLTQGKAVWEVRPPIDWNKGYAVVWLLDTGPMKGRWPIYIGDDQTDQDAMKMIRHSGVGIAVGPEDQKGAGHFSLADPKQVHGFLMWLVRKASSQGKGS